MTQYLVKQRSYINGAVVEAGETVDYNPPPGTTISDNLEPVKGRKLKPGEDAPSGDVSN